MASPVPIRGMRGRRTSRPAPSYQGEDDDDYQEKQAQSEQEQEEEEPAPRTGRQPGKETVNEDFEAEEAGGDEDAQPRKKGRKAASQAGPSQAGPSQRGKPPRGKPAAQTRRQLLQPGGSAAKQASEGPMTVEPRELNALQERMSEYQRVAESTRSKFKGTISRQEVDNLVRKVMRHMLFLNSDKPGVPVSRAELTKLVSGSTTQKKHNMAGVIITLAQYKMLEVFGLELREITKAPQRGANKAVAAAAGEGSKYLVLRSAVPPSLMAGCVQERREDPMRGFAAVLATLIDLSGGKVTSEELGPLLEDLGINLSHDHPTFGRPADLLEALARRRYINVERQQGPDGEVRIYTVAENAADEIGADNIKRFYEDVFARAGEEEEQAP